MHTLINVQWQWHEFITQHKISRVAKIDPKSLLSNATQKPHIISGAPSTTQKPSPNSAQIHAKSRRSRCSRRKPTIIATLSLLRSPLLLLDPTLRLLLLLRHEQIMPLIAEMPLLPPPTLLNLLHLPISPLNNHLLINLPSHLKSEIHLTIPSTHPRPINHPQCQLGAEDNLPNTLALLFAQGVQPVGAVLQDTVVFTSVAGLEEEGVVGVEHLRRFCLDLLAGEREVEAQVGFDGVPDVLVVHVDDTVVWEGWMLVGWDGTERGTLEDRDGLGLTTLHGVRPDAVSELCWEIQQAGGGGSGGGGGVVGHAGDILIVVAAVRISNYTYLSEELMSGTIVRPKAMV
jgi:hypothetical protein